jgi:AcrR family transcriptional regulator
MPEVTPLRAAPEPADGGEDDDELRAADGRVPGRRGRATRQRLLECTRDMLTTTSYRDVKVIDIARDAGTSPATFYQYFADVEAAILVLAEEMAQQGQHLTGIITRGSWRGRGAYDTALALVDEFLNFWDDHRPVLRVMDLATDEGDRRFQKIRVRLLNDITNALADVVRSSQADGRLPSSIDPMASAGILVSMMAHTAAHQYGFEFWGIRTKALRDSMARQVSWGVTGIKPPG